MDREFVRRRDLPHWDVPNAAYFITTCLEGSIPAQGLLALANHRMDLERQGRPENLTAAQWKVHCWKQNFVRIEEWLDTHSANRVLCNPELAQTVVNSLRYFAEERYDLYAFVLMPSHLHWLFQPRQEWVDGLDNDTERTPRQRIVYSLNRFTAGKCNKSLNRAGDFWQHESFNHWVRDVEELERIIRYIEENPVKAGLVSSPDEFPYSSAYLRKQLDLEWGAPILQDRRQF